MNKCITNLESFNHGEYCHTHQRLVNLLKREAFVTKTSIKKSIRSKEYEI